MMSVDDVAGALTTDPSIAEHERADWLRRIEADIVPAGWSTIVALRQEFFFDLLVLERLSLIHLGHDLPAPRICRVCADLVPVGWTPHDLCVACKVAA